MPRTPSALTFSIRALPLLPAVASSLLFRRGRPRATREDAFRDLFATVASLYERASDLKPEWGDLWRGRAGQPLPPKYQFGNDLAASAAHDMRFATFLLQRHRWKSRVQPLFMSIDETAWSAFQDAASGVSRALTDVADYHRERLLDDELDWIVNAAEQFDEASRRRRAAEGAADRPRAVAEGAYEPLYVAIQLSDRLVERLRFEAGQHD